MMTILEFCEEFRISHGKAKKMLARGVLLVDQSTDPRAARIREVFMSRNRLGALDICDLLEVPSIAMQLGRYAEKALEAVETVGNALEDQAPRDIALSVMDAANGDGDAIASFVDWLRRALPGDGSAVGYHWIAVRLMLPMTASVRKHEGEKIRRALARARKHEAFVGWWKYEYKSGRNVTTYARPQNSLASLDL